MLTFDLLKSLITDFILLISCNRCVLSLRVLIPFCLGYIAMDSFVGKYERTSAEKYDEFLKALDVNFLLRKAATVSSPVMEVSKEGDLWVIKTSTSLKSMELKFEVNLLYLSIKCLVALGSSPPFVYKPFDNLGWSRDGFLSPMLRKCTFSLLTLLSL